MSDSGGQEKTEKPTPFKLKEAKNKGQVSKSTEINSLLFLAAMLFLSYVVSESLMSNYIQFSKTLLEYDPVSLSRPEGLVVLFESIVYSLLDIFWPIIGVIILIAVVGNLIQTGPVFSFFPLKPDAQRLNPVKGFKKIFSKRMIYESVKTFIKIGLFAAIGYICILEFLPSLFAYMDIPPDAYGVKVLGSSRELVAKLLLAVLLVALIDMMYSRWDFMNQMKMSHKDLKDETKRREGDPLIRAKRKELQREALERSKSLANVPDADVLITNPTHISIALKFDQSTMMAPEMIAKGSGEGALKMKEIARKHNVPIVENKPLARLIFKEIGLNRPISENMFPMVAKIYAWLAANK